MFGNGRTLEQLLDQARLVNYVEPQKEYCHWTEDEFNMKSIFIALQSREQMESMMYLCKYFPPLKIVIKTQMKAYINNYTPTK